MCNQCGGAEWVPIPSSKDVALRTPCPVCRREFHGFVHKWVDQERESGLRLVTQRHGEEP